MTDPIDPIEQMDPKQLRGAIEQGGKVTIVDVRSAEEYASGHIDGALNIPVAEIEQRIGEIPPDTQVVTVCAKGGGRSCSAAQALQRLGYEDATPLRGGMQDWHE